MADKAKRLHAKKPRSVADKSGTSAIMLSDAEEKTMVEWEDWVFGDRLVDVWLPMPMPMPIPTNPLPASSSSSSSSSTTAEPFAWWNKKLSFPVWMEWLNHARLYPAVISGRRHRLLHHDPSTRTSTWEREQRPNDADPPRYQIYTDVESGSAIWRPNPNYRVRLHGGHVDPAKPSFTTFVAHRQSLASDSVDKQDANALLYMHLNETMRLRLSPWSVPITLADIHDLYLRCRANKTTNVEYDVFEESCQSKVILKWSVAQFNVLLEWLHARFPPNLFVALQGLPRQIAEDEKTPPKKRKKGHDKSHEQMKRRVWDILRNPLSDTLCDSIRFSYLSQIMDASQTWIVRTTATHAATTSSNSQRDVPDPRDYTLADARRSYHIPERFGYAPVANRVAGFVSLSDAALEFAIKGESTDAVWWINLICTDSRLQGQGLGAALLGDVFAWAKNLKIHKVRLHAIGSVIGFYRKSKFVFTKQDCKEEVAVTKAWNRYEKAIAAQASSPSAHQTPASKTELVKLLLSLQARGLHANPQDKHKGDDILGQVDGWQMTRCLP